MNIISNFFQSGLSNLLLSHFSSSCNSLINEISNNFNSRSSNHSYLSLVSSIQNNLFSLSASTLSSILSSLDLSFKNSSNRKRFYLVSKSNVPRTITTIFGSLTFTRTYYQSKLDGSFHFLLDEFLNIPKYDHYDPLIKALAIDKTFSSNQAQAGRSTGELFTPFKDLLSNRSINHISRQSVYNWIHKWNVPLLVYSPRNTPNSIYIMADEKFIGCQDQDYDIMIKSCVCFEDVVKVGKHRNQLKNRLTFSTCQPHSWDYFVDQLSNIYDFAKIKNIYLLGDGASWIRSGVEELKLFSSNKVEFHLCEFHFKQAIHHITKDTVQQTQLIDFVLQRKMKQFKQEVKKIIENNPNRTTIIQSKEKYIINNQASIRAMSRSKIGSSMESHISHCICDLFASRPKGYSTKTISKYLKLNDYRNNGYSILDLYLRSYQNSTEVTLDKQSLDLSCFEKKDQYYNINSQYYHNFYETLNGLAHHSYPL